MATATTIPTIDKRAAAQSIRVLMAHAGLTWEELQTSVLAPVSADKAEQEELSPEWRAMIDESIAEVERGEVCGPFNTVEEAMKALRE